MWCVCGVCLVCVCVCVLCVCVCVCVCVCLCGDCDVIRLLLIDMHYSPNCFVLFVCSVPLYLRNVCLCACVTECVSGPEGLLPCWLLCIQCCAPWWTVYLLRQAETYIPSIKPTTQHFCPLWHEEKTKPTEQCHQKPIRIMSFSFCLNVTTHLDQRNVLLKIEN